MEDNFDPFTANVQDAFGTASTTSTLRKEKKSNPKESSNVTSDHFAAFDAWNTNTAGPNSSTVSSDPWGASSNTSKTSTNLDDSFDPFSLKNQLKQTKVPDSTGFSSDPFSASHFSSTNSSDPFGESCNAFSNSNDPFSTVQTTRVGGDNSKTSSRLNNNTKVDFDAVFGPSGFGSSSTSSHFGSSTSASQSTVAKPPPNRSISLQKSETIANVPKVSSQNEKATNSKSLTKGKKGVSQSLSRPWGATYLDADSTISSKPHKSHSSKFSHLGDLLTGSPIKSGSAGGHSDSNTIGSKESSSKEKKKKSSYLSPFRPKKQHSFSGVDKSKSAVDLSHMGVPTPSAPPQPGVNQQMEALHVR